MVYVHNEKTLNNDIFTILNCFIIMRPLGIYIYIYIEREREREREREAGSPNLIIYQF